MDPRRRLLGLAAGLAAAFAGLALLVPETGPAAFDAPVLEGLHGLRSDGLTGAVRAFTRLGGGLPMTVTVAVTALLLVRRDARSAILISLAAAGAALWTQGLKVALSRMRPSSPPPVYTVDSFSFPSGHSMATAAFLLAVVLVVREARPRAVPPVAIAAGLLVLAIGLSRVYLGVHYPTDVLGGWLAGAAWTLLLYAGWYRRKSTAPPFDSPTADR